MKKDFENMPANLRLVYALIAVLFVLVVLSWTRSEIKTSSGQIKEWVDNNPEAILQSVNKYAMAQQEEAMKQQQVQSSENIAKFGKELTSSKNAGVINSKGTKDIVIFYDYNCGYCKIASKNVDELLKNRNDVRVVLRSIPILSEASRYASEVGAAILLTDAKKYPDYHRALMAGSARSKAEVNKSVESIGLNLSRIEKAISKDKEKIDEIINYNLNLAGQIGVNGTPAFVINGELIPGAVDVQTLNSKIGK